MSYTPAQTQPDLNPTPNPNHYYLYYYYPPPPPPPPPAPFTNYTTLPAFTTTTNITTTNITTTTMPSTSSYHQHSPSPPTPTTAITTATATLQIFLSEQLVNKAGDELQVSGANDEGDVITLSRNPGIALEHFKTAASMGHVEAAFRAALLYAEDEPFTIDKCKVCVVCVVCTGFVIFHPARCWAGRDLCFIL